METSEKLEALKGSLRSIGRIAVAFSGGVDSIFLLKIAAEAVGDNVIAITAQADNFPAREHREALEFARELGVRHVVLQWDAMSLPEFAENSLERCYHCKKALFTLVREAALEHGAKVLADGFNADDDDDYRPGAKAARELGVISPLRDAGLRKDEIRLLLRAMNIPAWEKPSFACLASRFPTGMRITREDLARVENAEQFFLDLGFRNIRVRHHGELARIELDPAERERFVAENLWERADKALQQLGYRYSTLDLRGYRTGSMNRL